MKGQIHNEGELADLSVKIEKKVVEDLKVMSDNSGLKIEDLVAIALKRFRSSHADYMGVNMDFD